MRSSTHNTLASPKQFQAGHCTKQSDGLLFCTSTVLASFRPRDSGRRTFVAYATKGCTADRFSRRQSNSMESVDVIVAVHWDHEPTPNPSQEGNCKDTEERLLPSGEGSKVGRFMERARKFKSTAAAAESYSPMVRFQKCESDFRPD